MEFISQLWADKIIAGIRSYDQVPVGLKAEVARCLKEKGYGELVTK